MPYQIYRPFKDDQYGNGLLLEEYNGAYYLVAALKTKPQAGIVKRWAYPQSKERKPINRALPWQIKIGRTHQEALDNLQYFMEKLKTEQ